MAGRSRRGAAARARPSRGRILLRRAVAVLCVLAVGGVVYLLLFTSLLGVRSVDVSGVHRASQEAVEELAAIPDQRPMLRVDTEEVADRVAGIDEVERAEVGRSWPSTIRIEVIEREEVAYFAAHDGIRLVDEHGVPFHEVGDPPDGLPELRTETVSSEDEVTEAVMEVLATLPGELRESVTTIGADTPGSVEFTLAGGETVHWGDAGQPDRKARVLDAILTQPGDVYDVSSPELPTVS
ncbi:FtsQ-type POTRA domain-containing protein [Haloechinothrix sp. LS1_15]|uniref:cell division protein FtsQ/DivIB n=1 Tax=Haloechinothrix sp. LS1_15 TaxID=2652248 RepID=UPI0029474D88|nr:FtsQ-type POTRA domain-containing protein [Haloechinothrix sp. LS1_15]MDV6013471.1 FtsQ-type POTRA domain-containing protein [Haloechinothrix sp. LS1_15]